MAIKTDSNFRQYSKTFKVFIACMNIAKKGKTFIFVHPNFVAVDIKTWRELKAAKDMPHIVYDEASEVTPKQWDDIDKALKKANFPKPEVHSTTLGPNYFHRNYIQKPIEKPEI